jgi:signal transduction histidine kinase/ligand-binding sensor domain-containing protein
MKKLSWVGNSFTFVSLVAILITSCNTKRSVPFPDNPSGFQTPVSKPFIFPESKPLVWKEIPADSIPKGLVMPLDVKKLPSKPFSINDFKPLKSPVATTPLNWNTLDEIKINLDTIKGKSVSIKKFRLPKPVVTRFNLPTKWEGTTSGILNLGQAEGLLGSSVYAMVADSLGVLWISTDRGLTKYCGDTFETYDFFAKTTRGSGEIIVDINIDKDGNLLVTGFDSGIYKVNLTSEIVTHYKIGAQFLGIQEDDNGRIWLTNLSRGLFFLEGDSSIKQLVLPKGKTERDGAFGISKDNVNNIWVGFRGKIAIINPDRNSMKLVGNSNELQLLSPYEFTQDSKGAVWISDFSKGVRSISLTEDKIYKLGPEQGFFGSSRGVVLDTSHRVWIMDNDTVYMFDPAAKHVKKIPTQILVVGDAPSKAIMDSHGTLWVGTANNGILLIDTKGMLAEHFNELTGLTNNDVWGTVEDKQNRVWIATYNGLNIYDPATEKLYVYNRTGGPGENNHRKLNLIDDDHIFVGSVNSFSIIDLKKNTITYFKTKPNIARIFWRAIYDKEGNLWFSSQNGIFKFNINKNVMWKLDKSTGLASNTIWFLIPDKDGKVWAGSNVGVNILDPQKNTIQYLGKKNGLNSDYTSVVFKSSKGEIIIGGDKGMSIINSQRSLITNVTAREGLIPELMFDMNEVNGRIQIGSQNGLIIVDRPEDTTSRKPWRFTNYSRREGFPFNDYNQGATTKTRSGKVWWGASPILTVAIQDPLIDSVAPRAFITAFNIMDQNTSFLNLDYINSKLSRGDTLWSSIDNPEYHVKDAFPKDSSYLSQNNISWDSLSHIYQIPVGLRLPHNQNSFNVSFTNPDVRGRDKIVYRYILEGAEEAWSEVSMESVSKNFYNVSPGEYTFKVATRGFNGVWSKPVELSFVILSPWWQTWWAYILYVITFSGAVWFTAQYRSRWLKKENKVLEEKVSHRTAQLKQTIDELKGTQSQLIQSEKMASLGELTAGIAHEIQNPLNFVNNFSEVNTELITEMKEELVKGNLDEAKQLADDISENEKKIIFHGKRADGIVKGMLQHSRNSNGKKEPTNINALADEYLRLAYHGLRAKDKSFNASMKTDFDQSIGTLDIIGQDMGRVILNLITNAFYAVNERKQQSGADYEPTVTVSTKRVGARIEIRVSDNGNGIPQSILDKIYQPFFTTKPTGQGTGLGLSMSYDIVTKAHNGELKVETQQGVGTTFIIKLNE